MTEDDAQPPATSGYFEKIIEIVDKYWEQLKDYGSGNESWEKLNKGDGSEAATLAQLGACVAFFGKKLHTDCKRVTEYLKKNPSEKLRLFQPEASLEESRGADKLHKDYVEYRAARAFLSQLSTEGKDVEDWAKTLQTESENVKSFGDVTINIAKDRNLLAHGRIESLLDSQPGKALLEHEYERFVLNYLTIQKGLPSTLRTIKALKSAWARTRDTLTTRWLGMEGEFHYSEFH